jgi:outer membrane protein assembly factor BamB
LKLIAVDPAGSGEVAPAYELTKEIPYCPTPIVAGERMFFATDRGIARCLNVKDGAKVWEHRLGAAFSASPVRAANQLIAVGEDGDVFVLAAVDRFELLAKNHLEDQFLATPAIANHRLYLRGEKFLWCIGEKLSGR